MKKTFVINFGTLSKMGGIQSIIFSYTEFMLSQGVRVIWLKNKNSDIYVGYKDLLLNSGVEIINVSGNHLRWFKHDKINFKTDEKVVVVSFTVFDMIRSLSLKKEYKSTNITCLYCVPDTTGRFFFIEQYFNGLIKKHVYKTIRKTLQQWDNAGLIVFCAYMHFTAMEKNYSITINDKHRKLLPLIYEPDPLDLKELEARSNRKGFFNIVTTGRFDFPHKGYMLGLVRAFARLKIKYPQLTLTIIGKGQHEQQLQNEIDKVEKNLRDSIKILGEVPHDQLHNYYKNMHLSVAVAGAACDAAKLGVVSIVARNFCEGECEVYGFLPEMQCKAVSKEPGELVDSFIEQVIKMSDSDYQKRCIDAHEAIRFNELGEAPNPWFYFDVAEKAKTYEMSVMELFFWKNINYARKVRMLFNK